MWTSVGIHPGVAKQIASMSSRELLDAKDQLAVRVWNQNCPVPIRWMYVAVSSEIGYRAQDMFYETVRAAGAAA